MNESNEMVQVNHVKDKIISIKNELEKRDISYSKCIEELKASTNQFGSNYYWLVFVLIYGGVYFLK